MTRSTQVELAILPFATAGAYLLAGVLPREVALGWVCVAASLTLLMQGFLRDLWLLYQEHVRPTPKRYLACMCVESTLGLSGVLLGGVLALVFSGIEVTLTPLLVTATFAGVVSFGFLTREMVISFSPFQIRRDPEHHSIVFSLK